MASKEEMIAAIHRVYRKDAWIQELFQAAGIGEDDVEGAIDDALNQLFIDTATWSLDFLERDLGIIPSGSYADRRSVIEAKLKTSDTLTLRTLQIIAESWENGDIDIAFTNGKIRVRFMGEKGIPTNLADFKHAIENAKPAHLAILYVVAYLTWDEAKTRFIWNSAKQFTWSQFRNQV